MSFSSANVKSILVIDDDRDDFELVTEAISEIDPEIKVYFLDRCEDINKFESLSFDLVLLDINMPRHDGFTWLKSIRGKGFNDVPVVMYTNSLFPDHIKQAYSCGANLYYAKPESYVLLKKGLSALIGLDWKKPMEITAQYYNEGNYKVFTA